VLGEVELAEAADGLRTDERDVAGEDEQMLGGFVRVEGEVGLEHLQGVAGAALFGLQDEADAGGFDGGFYAVRLVADDAVDVVGRDDGGGRGDDVREQGAAADLVEDFGAAGLEAGALAGGHDGDCEVVECHRRIWSHVGSGWFHDAGGA